MDYAVKEAAKTLKSINSFDLDQEQITRTDEVLEKAKQDLMDARNFSSPLNGTVKSFDELTNGVETLDNKLNDLQSYSEKALKSVLEITRLNAVHKYDL